jgi:hypothetical protein
LGENRIHSKVTGILLRKIWKPANEKVERRRQEAGN